MASDFKQLTREELDEKAFECTTKLIELCLSQWIESQHIRSLTDSLNLPTVEIKMYFLTSLIGVIRKIPNGLFHSQEMRDQTIKAAQDLLDEIILSENLN